MQNNCVKCQKPLTLDDIGASKKLINRGASEFMCVACLAKHYSVAETAIFERIDYFRKQGCTLFDAE